MRVFLVLLFLFSVSSTALAEDYYWQGSSGGHSSSAMGACPSSVTVAGQKVPVDHIYFYDPTYGVCIYMYDGNHTGQNDSEWNGDSVVRGGDSCPAGATYNKKTGACDSSKKDGELCDDQSGATASNPMIWSSKSSKCVLFTESDDTATCAYLGAQSGPGSSYTVAGNWDGGTPSAPPVFAQDGLSCEVSTVSTTDCVAKGTSGAVECNVVGKYSGKVSNKTNVADAKDAACPGGTCEPILPASTTKSDPCVYSGSGSSVSCTSNTENSKDGTQKCGTVNGSMTCFTVPPTSNGVKIATTVTTTPSPDGGTTAVKTDNATKTVCSGINKCSTSTSTTTTTTKTSSSGATTSTDTKCTGTCGSTGTGITPGPSGGSGSGSGDGESGEGNCTTEDCGSGGAGELKDPENGSFDPQAAEWDTKIDTAKKDLHTALDKMKDSFKPVSDIDLGSGGGQLYCPPDVSVLGRSISFCVDKYSDSLSWLGAAIYAVCALAALFIVFG